MANILEKIQRMWNPIDEDYEDEYEDDYEDDDKVDVETTKEDVQGPSLFKRTGKVVNINQKTQLQVVVYKPVSFGQDTRDMAKSLMNRCAIVLNLEQTKKDEARRIIDFLSGVAFSLDGKINKIASATFIITPVNVELSGEEIFDEFENSGVYF